MTMDFDNLNYVTSTKLKNVNDNNVKPVSPENKLLNPTRRRGLFPNIYDNASHTLYGLKKGFYSILL